MQSFKLLSIYIQNLRFNGELLGFENKSNTKFSNFVYFFHRAKAGHVQLYRMHQID